MTIVVVLLLLAVVGVLAWSWWSSRIERDPASSVDHFHRALSAMEPRVGAVGRERDDRS